MSKKVIKSVDDLVNSRKQKNRTSRHERYFSTLKGKQKFLEDLEKLELKDNLEKSMEYGQSLIEDNKELNINMANMIEELEEEKKKVADLKRTNEHMEEKLFALKSKSKMDELEAILVKEKEEEMNRIKKERDLLQKSNEKLRLESGKYRKKYDEKKLKYLELFEKLETMEKIFLRAKDKFEKNKAAQEELKKITIKYEKIRQQREEEEKIHQYQVRKLKRTNHRVKKEFGLKLQIITNEFGLGIHNLRSSVSKFKNTFKSEMQKINEDLNDDLNELLTQFEIRRKQNEEIEKKRAEKIKLLNESKEKVDEEKTKVTSVDTEMLIKWIKKYLRKVPCVDVKIIRKIDKATFANGIILLSLISRFLPKVLPEKELLKYSASNGPKNLKKVFEILKAHLTIIPNELILNDLTLTKGEIILPQFINDIYERMSLDYTNLKNQIREKAIELSFALDGCIRRVQTITESRWQKEEGPIIEKRRKCNRLFNRINVSFCYVRDFFLASENFEFVQFYRGCELGKKLSKLNSVLLEKRRKNVSSGVEHEEKIGRVVGKYNVVSTMYFKWSKLVQKKFLEPTESENSKLNERNIYPDYEDDEKTLKLKNNELKRNAEYVKRMWKLIDGFNDKEIEVVRKRFEFNKSEVEMENETIAYALKGIMTSKVRGLLKWKIKDELVK